MDDLTDEQWTLLNPRPHTCRCSHGTEDHSTGRDCQFCACSLYREERRRAVREVVKS